MVALHFIEQELWALNNPHYKIQPLKKLWGTNFACEYEWADGKSIEDLYPSNGKYSLFVVCSDALRAYGALDGDRFSGGLSSDVEKIKQVLPKIGGLEKALSIAYDADEKPELTDEMKGWVQGYIKSWKLYKYVEGRYVDDLDEKWEDSRFVERLLSDIRQEQKALRISLAYQSLCEDVDHKIRFDRYTPSGLCEGYMIDDFAPWNILVRDSDFEDGGPIFTIIDQYHMGGEETDYQRKKHGGLPSLRLG